MSIVDRVKFRAQRLKVQRSRCVVVARPLPLIPEEYPDSGPDFHYKAVFDHTDRHLVDLVGEKRANMLAPFYAKGGFTMMGVHVPTDRAITRIGMLTYSPPASEAAIGMPNFRLARDECFMLDVWTHPDFRRQGVAFTLAYQMGRIMDHEFPEKRWVYGHADKANEASLTLMREVYGMWPVQEFTQVDIGNYWVRSVPGTDEPKFGPISKEGRHSGAGNQMPGRPRSGDLYRQYHHAKGFARAPERPELVSYLAPGPEWFDNDHPLDAEGNPGTPETLPREFGDT